MLKFFVAGTDTGIGKTWVSLLLIDSLKRQGYAVAGFKPLACGVADPEAKELAHDDAIALQSRSSVALPYRLVNPVCLREPTAPHIAAAKEGVRVTVEDLLAHSQAIEAATAERAEEGMPALVCEGVGGWDVPVNDRQSMGEYACRSEAKIILVVGLRLGCLNHAILSCRAIRDDLARHSGEDALARLVGLVINRLEPQYPNTKEYIQALKQSTGLDTLGDISFGGKEPIALP